MTVLYYVSIFFFLLLCFLLCFVILIQESKSMGLGASLGGETSDSLFGTATADVLKRFTAWLVAIFLISCVILSLWTAAKGPALKKRAPHVVGEEVDYGVIS